jgi:chromosome segregation ATPase
MADLGEGLDKFDEEVENLKNTKMKLFGITMTPTTIGATFALLSAIGGSLYGGFEVYKDYMDMKEIVQNIDVDEIAVENAKTIAKLEEAMVRIEQAIEYTRDIKSGLRDDIMSIEKQVDRTEDMVRESEEKVREMIRNAEERFENKRDALQNDYDQKANDLRSTSDRRMTELENTIERDMKELEDNLNKRLQRALDNPLAN